MTTKQAQSLYNQIAEAVQKELTAAVDDNPKKQ